MELEVLQELIKGDFATLQSKVVAGVTSVYSKYSKEYDPSEHAVHDTAIRKKKEIQIENEDGSKAIKPVEVTRLSVPMQKKIVRLAAAFLCGNPIELSANVRDDDKTAENLLSLIKKVWDDNKLDYESKNLAKLMMSETECAELWFTEKADKDYWNDTANQGKEVRFRSKILAASKGDSLYPVFNGFGNMIAFARGYKTSMEDGKTQEHFDLYTEERFYFGTRSSTAWDVKEEENTIKEIPVIYFRQDQVEWADVQHLIERFETSISNHGDTNDYFGSPSFFIEGTVKGFAEKGEQGKVFEGEKDTKMSVLSWDSSPESVKLEQQNLRSLILDMTDTPDISIEQMKSLGTYSGIALKMLFLGAHLKAAEKEEIFGKGIQRRINYLKNALIKINSSLSPAVALNIKPKFEYYLPKNDVEKVETITQAKQAGILSTKTSVEINPLVADPVAELEQIQNDGLDKEFNNDNP